MADWLRNGVLYEINTWVWLNEWSTTLGRPLTLAQLPDAAWDPLAELGVQAVWLMGVWERSPAAVALTRRNRRQMSDWRQQLPDLQPSDIVGSPYSIRRYQVAAHFGGAAGLAAARTALARRGIRLILDFVPNHLAPDHPWVSLHPEWFIQGSKADLRRNPDAFLEVVGRIFARGRDPCFPPWSDVLQLNAFNIAHRHAMLGELAQIAEQCDGVRCDMAMLVMNQIFARTWSERAGTAPATDYWPEMMGEICSSNPGFSFVAEAYWGLETDLLRQGFNACYDKELCDRLKDGSAQSVREHLARTSPLQLVRFLENHDEPRAVEAFQGAKGVAAAVVLLTVPGTRLLHDGQLEGRAIRTAVHLGRRASEPRDEAIWSYYHRLLRCTADPVFHEGTWRLCNCSGWPDNQSYRNLMAWSWLDSSSRCLVVVNYSTQPAQGRVQLLWPGLNNHPWSLSDLLNDRQYEAPGDELASSGLFVDLPPWGGHILKVLPGGRPSE
jgi:hypothetical protein